MDIEGILNSLYSSLFQLTSTRVYNRRTNAAVEFVLLAVVLYPGFCVVTCMCSKENRFIELVRCISCLSGQPLQLMDNCYAADPISRITGRARQSVRLSVCLSVRSSVCHVPAANSKTKKKQSRTKIGLSAFPGAGVTSVPIFSSKGQMIGLTLPTIVGQLYR